MGSPSVRNSLSTRASRTILGRLPISVLMEPLRLARFQFSVLRSRTLELVAFCSALCAAVRLKTAASTSTRSFIRIILTRSRIQCHTWNIETRYTTSWVNRTGLWVYDLDRDHRTVLQSWDNFFKAAAYGIFKMYCNSRPPCSTLQSTVMWGWWVICQACVATSIVAILNLMNDTRWKCMAAVST